MKYNDEEMELDIIKIERTCDQKTEEAALSGLKWVNHLFIGAALYATATIGTVSAKDNTEFYQQIGLAIPAFTTAYSAFAARKMEANNFKEEEKEIISVDQIQNETTQKIVECGKRAWQMTKFCLAAASLGAVGYMLYENGLEDLRNYHLSGMAAAVITDLVLLKENHPLTVEFDAPERTLMKGPRK